MPADAAECHDTEHHQRGKDRAPPEPCAEEPADGGADTGCEALHHG